MIDHEIIAKALISLGWNVDDFLSSIKNMSNENLLKIKEILLTENDDESEKHKYLSKIGINLINKEIKKS